MTTEVAAAESSFEASVARLEAIVRQMEDGALPLEQMLALFEEGTELGKRCQKLLDLAELRVKQVVQDTEGSIRVIPFDPDQSSDGGPAF